MGIQVHHLFPGEKANICDDSVQRHEKDSGPVERSPAQLMRVNKKQTDLFRSCRTPTRTVDADGKTTWFVYCLRRVPSLPKVCTQLLGANHGSSGSGSAGSSTVHLAHNHQYHVHQRRYYGFSWMLVLYSATRKKRTGQSR